MYDKGQGIPQDYNEAVKWYQLAADRGKTNVYRIAKKGVTPALNILTDDAKQGIAEAQVALGVMHEYGYSFPQDNNEAFKWFQLAADRGKTNVYRIAKKGVTPALNILTSDAKQGIAKAQVTLGRMYDQGQGVAQDYSEALKWFQLAADQGYEQGKENIYRIAKKGVTPALNILTDDAK
ncbi:MAG: sel1 repeat family protein, partial [Nitrospina sp.]|nr:sel1 repeat family protein [Nitrospina sp.]